MEVSIDQVRDHLSHRASFTTKADLSAAMGRQPDRETAARRSGALQKRLDRLSSLLMFSITHGSQGTS